MNRRSFCTSLLTSGTGVLAGQHALRAAKELSCDIAIIGGGVGGCAAALAALRNGMRVILTEETDWIGGQLTAQAVPPDEHRWIESIGCTRLYREYRNAVRDHYRRRYPLTEAARAMPHLNPGNSWVSRIAHEPRVSLAVLEAMLAPYASGGRLTMLPRHQPVAADVSGDRVRTVQMKSLETGALRTVHAKYFLDATELSDLLPLTKTEYVTGSESRRQTGEPHAPEEARPANMQAFTICFAMDYRPGEDHTIGKPEEYTFWRDYVPNLHPAWTGKLLSLDPSEPATLKPRRLSFDPECDGKASAAPCLWTYRRIADKKNFTPGSYPSDITLVNWPQNDYWLGNICDVSPQEAALHLQRARQLSLSLLFWLQTEVPRPGGGQGWPGLRLRPDVVGTEDGLAKAPYVRESRRIQAEYTVLEHELGNHFPDSVGIGSYRIDLHPSTSGDNYIDIASPPFEIPLGALLPKRLDNLLPAAKNIGVTHITNGCYRLHPVEWNIGEAAGCLAAAALQRKTSPRAIRNNPKSLAEFQAKIRDQGIPTAWPSPMPR